MMLHAADGSTVTLLICRPPLAQIMADLSKTWLLTIREPLVLRPIHSAHATTVKGGEWGRHMDKAVQIHLSVPLTRAELTAGHRSGEIVMVLVFASTVPFIWNGTARYLILRKVDAAGTRWERVGRLAMALMERDMNRFKSTADMIAALPVKKFGRYITLV